MPPPKSRAESLYRKEKLVNSYHELLEEFSSKDLRNVGNYVLGRLIGKGSFGKVYLATHKLTNGSKVVLKSSDREDSNLAREIHHHRQFLHPHIARLYEVIVTEKLVWLVLEYCPGDELYNHLLRNGALPIDKVQKIFTQLVGAVSYVHSKSCVHRDLKLENILLDKHENVKLCDFGFTREYEGKSSYLQTFCGTICYSAPEMLKGEKYAGEKVDVWSLGIILYALIAGELPFDEDDDQVTKKMILTEGPKYNDKFTEDSKSLINLLLSKRPLIRPALGDVLAHPFLAEHAPQQQAILKLTRPAPFSTLLEKTTLERMRSAGVNTDHLVESVLAQKCDALTGWWALLIEKEDRKEKRRERKRREREAEAKNLRRLSAASSRLERISAALVEVDEENQLGETPRSRGRRERRSIPNSQLVIPDLPKLPETRIVTSPDSIQAPPPIEKDAPIRSASSSHGRPIPPPKERRVSRGSTLHMSASQPDLIRPHGILRRQGTRRRQYPIISRLASLKHWLVESTKRTKSPHSKNFTQAGALRFLSDRSSPPKNKDNWNKNQPTTAVTPAGTATTTPTNPTFNTSQHGAPPIKRSASLSPGNASFPGAVRPSSMSRPSRRLNSTSSHHRNSLSPSPLTPRNSYRRSSAGLRGRKSTSSSVSSIRTIHHAHSHSKTSSISSNSIDTVSTPTASMKAMGISRSPHTSVKVLSNTPSASSPFPSNIRLVRGGPDGGLNSSFNESAPSSSNPVFARRKRSAFKGPAINTSNLLAGSGSGTPGLPRTRGSLDSGRGEVSMTGARKSQIIEEEEETEDDSYTDDEDIEEVDNFSPVDEKIPTFIEIERRRRRSSVDMLGTVDISQGIAQEVEYTVNPTTPTTSVPVEVGAENEQKPEARLLPAAEISEPKHPPFYPTSPPSETEPELIRPPRSSSLRERTPGTPGSIVANDSPEILGKTTSPRSIQKTIPENFEADDVNKPITT